MKRSIVGGAYGVWLFAMLLVFYLGRGEDENALQFALIAGALPAALQLFLMGLSPHGLLSPARFALALMLVIILSYVAAGTDARLAPTTTDGPTIPLNWLPVVFTINTLYTFVLAMIVAGSPDRRLLRTAAAVFAVLAGPFLLWVVLTGEYVWGRLSAQGIQPNFWGLMGLAVGIAAITVRPRLLGAICLSIGVLTIYQSSARGSLAALLVGLAAVMLITLRDLKSYRLAAALGAATAAIFGLMLLVPVLPDLQQVVVSDVLKLDDPYRGLGQGATGRGRGWAEAAEIWVENPVFGVGFRLHQQYIEGISSAHNAYLSMAADTGIAGILLYIGLLCASLSAAMRIRDASTRVFSVALLVAYVVIGFFERRAINSGNPFGILFLMTCFYALAEAQILRFIAASDGEAPREDPTPAHVA